MRRLWPCLLVLAVVLLAAAPADSEAPAGPHLAFVRATISLRLALEQRDPNAVARLNLLRTGLLGEEPRILLGDGIPTDIVPISGPAWSPDGSTVAVGGGKGLLTGSSDIYALAADGTGLRRVTDLGNASSPVYSADGQTIYFSRTKHPLSDAGQVIKRPKVHLKPSTSSIWAVGADGNGLRRVTASNPAVLDTPGSVSPLTGDLAFSRSVCHRRCRNSIRLISPATGTETRFVSAASEPAFSPNGLQVAYASLRDHNWPKHRDVIPSPELYVQDLSTGATRRLTRTRGVSESAPSWDPAGQRLAYIRFGSLVLFRLFEINADGSCSIPVTPRPRHPGPHLGPLLLGVAWQPGPGREAGPIAC